MGGFTSNSSKWLWHESRVLKRAQRQMAASIQIRAVMVAPRDKGDLRQDGRIKDNSSGSTSVIFGSEDVPYARIHELGGKTGKDYKTEITAKHYLKEAGDSVAKENVKKYVDMSR